MASTDPAGDPERATARSELAARIDSALAALPGEQRETIVLPADGLTQQDAAERVVRTLYQAVIDQDADGLKRVCPLCRNMGDEFLRAIIFKPGKDTRVVEILDVGPIRRSGRSALGPIVAIPATLGLQNGTTVEEQMIVQFRQFGERLSCVVHGPYGQARQIG